MIVIILRQNHFLQVEYFDQLRNKYHQVKEKVDVYSRKCFHLEERLRTLNTKQVIKPKVIEGPSLKSALRPPPSAQAESANFRP